MLLETSGKEIIEGKIIGMIIFMVHVYVNHV